MEGFCSKEDSSRILWPICLKNDTSQQHPLGRKTFFSKEIVVLNRRTSFSLDESYIE